MSDTTLVINVLTFNKFLATNRMIYSDEQVSNMVAGTAGNSGFGQGRIGGAPRFDEADFDGWVIFLKAFLMKFDRGDLALSDPMPMRETDDGGSDVEYDDEEEEAAYQKSKQRWLTRNMNAYSFIMDSCLHHQTARKVAKAYKGTMAKVLLKNLGERFKIIQQNVKQAEITKFNTMCMEKGETCSQFVDRVKEQADRLENMGEKVSNLNLLTRLKEGVHKVHAMLAHNLYTQASEDVKVVEDSIRGYDNTPMAKLEQAKGDSTVAINIANFAGETPGKNTQKIALSQVSQERTYS